MTLSFRVSWTACVFSFRICAGKLERNAVNACEKVLGSI
jgi:hypothetical protein